MDGAVGWAIAICWAHKRRTTNKALGVRCARKLYIPNRSVDILHLIYDATVLPVVKARAHLCKEGRASAGGCANERNSRVRECCAQKNSVTGSLLVDGFEPFLRHRCIAGLQICTRTRVRVRVDDK